MKTRDDVELIVVDDPAVLAAERLRAVALAGGHIALAGGSTPKAAYERAAAAGGDWSGATLWLGDERCVPADDERSNGRMARESLIDRLGEPGPTFEPVDTTLDPEEAAADYARRMRHAMGEDPAFDLALLGLGPDSHTASLFPDSPALDATEPAVAGPPGMDPHVTRVTVTFPVFARSTETLVLVTGASKAEAMVRAFGADPDPAAPASRLSGAGLRVVADAAAAEGLL